MRRLPRGRRQPGLEEYRHLQHNKMIEQKSSNLWLKTGNVSKQTLQKLIWINM